MPTTKKSHLTVNSSCVLYDWCTGRVLRPYASARFEVLGSIEEYERAAQTDQLLSVNETARRVGLKPKTLYNQIENGRIGAEHGLVRLGRNVRLDFQKYRLCVERGDFAESESPCT